MGADLDNSRQHSQFIISTFQFPIFNFPILIFQFQSGITRTFFYSQTKKFRSFHLRARTLLVADSASPRGCEYRSRLPTSSSRNSKAYGSSTILLVVVPCVITRFHPSQNHHFPVVAINLANFIFKACEKWEIIFSSP